MVLIHGIRKLLLLLWSMVVKMMLLLEIWLSVASVTVVVPLWMMKTSMFQVMANCCRLLCISMAGMAGRVPIVSGTFVVVLVGVLVRHLPLLPF